ncbi:unnamed protein product [Auanema sp. JU1783]|nr:unnamed protein product [Auanema sp. JU1783]
MPMLRVVTNLATSLIRETFEMELTKIAASSLNKPIERIAVEVSSGARLIHGGTNDPVVIINVRSIGSLSPDQNFATTQAITALCVDALKLKKDKVIIEFYDLDPNNVGFNGTTAARK